MRVCRFVPAIIGLMLALCASTNAQTTAGAIIDSISNAGELMKAEGAKPDPLSAEDEGYVLATGWKVRCSSGKIRLRLVNKSFKDLKPNDPWYTIPRSLATSRTPDQKALDNFSRPAGIERPGPTIIYSPAPDSVVSTDTFEVRWLPQSSLAIVSVEIRESDKSAPLWRKGGINGLSGRLEGTDAQQVLARYRADGGSGQLLVIISGPSGDPYSVEFTLLSHNEENELRLELSRWEESLYKGSVMRNIGRAYSFARRGLFAESAREYDEALRISPRSRAVIKAALDANVRTGNVTREEELKALLRSERQD